MGLYNADGSLNVTVSDGTTVGGVYAPDGSYRVSVVNTADGVDIGQDAGGLAQVAFADSSTPTAPDTFLKRVAAGVLALINGTSAMGLLIYNTFTSSSVFERGFMRWTSNVFEIGNEHTGGSNRITRIIGPNGIRLSTGTDRITLATTALQPSTDAAMALGTTTARYNNAFLSGYIGLGDGVTAPATLSGTAYIYVDTADGDLKIKFGDGTIKTIVVDT